MFYLSGYHRWQGRGICAQEGEVDETRINRIAFSGPCAYCSVLESPMASLPCQFCGKEAGFFGRTSMFRCTMCGTVLCDNCVRKVFSLTRSLFSLICIGLTYVIAVAS